MNATRKTSNRVSDGMKICILSLIGYYLTQMIIVKKAKDSVGVVRLLSQFLALMLCLISP